MLIIRYKTLVDFPGIPAGEVLIKQTGQHLYVGTTHPEFYMSQLEVEDAPETYRFVSVTDDALGEITDIQTSARQISKTEFLKRITTDENAAILMAAKGNIGVEVWLYRFDRHQGLVNLDDPLTAEGMQALEDAGLLAVGRAAEIVG